jgi:uncharacterized membrane protein
VNVLVPAILFYDVVLAVHIAAIVLAFGITFSYPALSVFVTRSNPRMLPTLHAAQVFVSRVMIGPAAILAFVAGAYLASDRDYWSETWVSVPMVILIALIVSGPLFFDRQERRAAELAARDVEASGPGEVRLSPEYEAVASRLALVGAIADVLILVAVFVMTAKPFA